MFPLRPPRTGPLYRLARASRPEGARRVAFRVFAPVPAFAGLLALGLALGAAPALAKGITVRFLASPAEDSIVRYQILRADAPGATAIPVGELGAVPGADTVAFPDSSAVKGKPYAYTIRSIDSAGAMSDPSEATLVGFPHLDLPDTLRADRITGLVRFLIPASCDPLRGSAPMTLALVDSSRFSLAFAAVTGAVAFRTRSGRADSGWAVLRAEYFGKFADRDSVLVFAGAQAVSLAPADGRGGMGGIARPPWPKGLEKVWNGRNAAGRRVSGFR
jgi:hypothetical protein